MVIIPILLPVGHDRSIARLPHFALGVIVLCTVVQCWSTLAWWQSLSGAPVLSPVALGGYHPIRGLHPNLLFSTFVHGDWFHLAGNMLFLYVTAFNLEDRWGWQVFAPFYLVAGTVATMTFGTLHPGLDVPLVGASGAVAAAMGAFLVCHAKARLRIWYFWWPIPLPRLWLTGTFNVRAYVAFPIWFALEALSALAEGGSLVAHSAHVGGFAFGAAFAALMMLFGWDAARVDVIEQRTNEQAEVWREEPEFLAAAEHIERGELEAARPLLEQVLARAPEHTEARLALTRLLLHLGHPQEAAGLGSLALDHLCRTDARRAVELFAELVETAPSIRLSDTALAHVARAAQARSDIQHTFVATRRLLLDHPESPQVPRAMLEAAALQARFGRTDLARLTLENLVEVFPMDPVADRARQQLAAP